MSERESMDNMLNTLFSDEEEGLVRNIERQDTSGTDKNVKEQVNLQEILKQEAFEREQEKNEYDGDFQYEEDYLSNESGFSIETVEKTFGESSDSNDLEVLEGFGDDKELEDYEAEEIARAALEWEPPAPRSDEYHIVNEFISTGWVGLLHLDQVLTEAVMAGASDVHITADQTIAFSVNGDILKCHHYIEPDYEVMHLLIHEGMLTHQAKSELNLNMEYDGSYTIQYGPCRGTRTRINVGQTFGKYFIVFRIINDYIPKLSELGVEDEIVEWSKFPNGLFMLCGPTGTGKSTTLASVVRNLQLTSKKKVITIERPIEYIYPDDAPSLIVQREVGMDTRGFYEGLTSAMRQNPDVILLGEVRNTEEVTELLRAAETGHLAISTMHTNSVATTINRVQNLFSGNEQRRIMSTLADTLRGIGNQVLVKKIGGGRFAVRELLTINHEIKDLIMQGDVRGIRDYQIERELTMEHKLAKAVEEGKCTLEEAEKHAADKIFFDELMRRR